VFSIKKVFTSFTPVFRSKKCVLLEKKVFVECDLNMFSTSFPFQSLRVAALVYLSPGHLMPPLGLSACTMCFLYPLSEGLLTTQRKRHLVKCFAKRQSKRLAGSLSTLSPMLNFKKRNCENQLFNSPSDLLTRKSNPVCR